MFGCVRSSQSLQPSGFGEYSHNSIGKPHSILVESFLFVKINFRSYIIILPPQYKTLKGYLMSGLGPGYVGIDLFLFKAPSFKLSSTTAVAI